MLEFYLQEKVLSEELAITSKLKARGSSILLTNDDLERGRLTVKSKIKPDKVFTAKKRLFRMNVGRASNATHERVVPSLFEVVGKSPGT